MIGVGAIAAVVETDDQKRSRYGEQAMQVCQRAMDLNSKGVEAAMWYTRTLHTAFPNHWARPD